MNSPSEDKKKQNQLQNLKQISVNDEIITPDQIIHEMQHHESNSQDTDPTIWSSYLCAGRPACPQLCRSGRGQWGSL